MDERTQFTKQELKKEIQNITIYSISIVIREYKLKILLLCPSDWQIFKHFSIL